MMLIQEGCQQRQTRLLESMQKLGLDGVVLSDLREIHYFTGLDLNPAGSSVPFPALLSIAADGSSWLACQTDGGDALVDEQLTYEPHLLFTMNPDPMARLNEVVAARVAGGRPPKRIGYQGESMPHLLADTISRVQRPGSWVEIDLTLQALEKRKDPDEVALLQRAIDCSLAAYDAASNAIEPGANELFVKEAGHTAATLTAEKVIFHNGDYQCGTFGGFARDRRIEGDELYIIDAWTIYEGYWSDLCRTFAVDSPTDLQGEIYDHVAQSLIDVQAELRPGRTGDEIWRFLDARLREHPHLRESGLVHHAGHGVGLRPHEAPDLNRDRGGLIEVGDVISVEPGAYSDQLRQGVRLENTFLITETGAELLSDYPLSPR